MELPSPTHSEVYNFFDPEDRGRHDINHLLQVGIPLESAKLINKINQHNRSLTLIGVLPNQLRNMLKTTNEDGERAFEEISKELFYQGYKIWNARKRMVTNFWKTIAPNEWKPQVKKQKEKKGETQARNACVNPFHFLAKHKNLSHSRPTPCPCSNVFRPPPLASRDIREFFSFTQVAYDFSTNNKKQKLNPSFPPYPTRADIIRCAHDRDKCVDNSRE
jgi:hypothetical protein